MSAHPLRPEQGASVRSYGLLLDTITVLEKSGLAWDFENETNTGALLSEFNQITKQTNFCITAESSVSSRHLSNCISPEKEKITQEAIIPLPSGALQNIRFSMQKERI